MPGHLLEEKYRIVERIAEGAMGAIYVGEHVHIGRRVAIKVMHDELADSPDGVVRFHNEARAAARIGSDHIVQIFDAGCLPSGGPFIVMEYLEGETLFARVSGGRLTCAEAAGIFVQLLDGLEAAHQAGIVHRDLKPDNVFLVNDGHAPRDFVKILDFGISKFLEVQGELEVTRVGFVMGSPYFMSPEQLRDTRSVDQRTDIYAVGVMLYQAITGRLPFEGSSYDDLVRRIFKRRRPDPRSVVRSIDRAFAEIVVRAMSLDPEARFPSARAMQRELLAWRARADAAAGATGHASAGAPPRRTRSAPSGVRHRAVRPPSDAAALTAAPTVLDPHAAAPTSSEIDDAPTEIDGPRGPFGTEMLKSDIPPRE